MFGRRVPVNVIFILSSLLALVCGVIAYHALDQGVHFGGSVALVFAFWFAIDAIRSFFWTQSSNNTKCTSDKEN